MVPATLFTPHQMWVVLQLVQLTMLQLRSTELATSSTTWQNKTTNDIIKIVSLDHCRKPWVDKYAPVTKAHS